MDIKDTLVASLLATSASFAVGPFVTWNGADDDPQIHTGLDNGTETSGYWYTYGDDAVGGVSAFVCVTDAIDPPFITCTDATLDICKGFCGSAVLSKGSYTGQPFIGVGFNVVSEASSPDYNPGAGDATAWDGLCITYVSDIDLRLELGLGPIVDSTISYANPAVTLPAEKTLGAKPPYKNKGKKVVVSWSDFKQPTSYTGTVKFDGEQAAKQLVAVKFILQADPGEYSFNICAVGPKDGTCPEKCGIPSSEVGIKIARGGISAMTVLNGRTLAFTGVKSTATAEVLNSLGQVVVKSAIEGDATTLNLSHLDAGIYLVRVVGKSTNFTNKIMLK